MATTGPVIIVGPVGLAAALELAGFNLRNAALHPFTHVPLTQLAAPANENREADLVLRVRQQHAPRDLPRAPGDAATRHALGLSRGLPPPLQHPDRAGRTGGREQIGRASCRERG